ncbi:MAG: response regulator [Methylococcales bacterium]|jgi:twitching motility two-component system response regulator PilH|nr:response regulator [Methylococcales bacterium]MBT7409697.1 response regulator [Methylococcales bacterium]
MEKILIVDDSPTETYVIKKMLENNGYTSLEATNGFDGIEMAKKEKPDLILMDVVMPGINGFQTTRRLNRDPETTDIPVIIVTIRNQNVDKVWGLRQGAQDYLTKPLEENVLIPRIKKLLN